MAVTLVSTIAGSTSNSLVSLAYADSYHENLQSFSRWDVFSDDDKKRALIQASASYHQLSWWGDPVYEYPEVQALPFPRVHPGVSDGTTIHKKLEWATCEHALDLAEKLASGTSDERAQMRAAGVLAWNMGNRGETLAPSSPGSMEEIMQQYSTGVRNLLQGWVKGAFSTDSGRRPQTGANRDRYGLSWPSELMP